MLLSKLLKRRNTATKSVRAVARAAAVENLEGRRMFALLGLGLDYPLTFAEDRLPGALTYTASTGVLQASAVPTLFFPSEVDAPVDVLAPSGSSLTLKLTPSGAVDASGTPVLSFTMTGVIDLDGDTTPEFSGTLLTGTATEFGFLDDGNTDSFEIRLTPTGGALRAPYFTGKDIGIAITAESSTFVNSFNSDFSSIVKAFIAPIPANPREPVLSSIAGNVYWDKDLSGTLNSGDVGLGGQKVTLTGVKASDGSAVNIVKFTNPDGSYLFDSLEAGTYKVVETQPVGYNDYLETVGTSGGSAAVNDEISSIILPEGVNAISYNFGEWIPGSLQGIVWHDVNDNGNIDSSEAGIPGVKVTLTGTTPFGPVTLVDYTDAFGSYSFENLAPGTYTLTETQPSAYNDGKDSLGSLGGSAAVNDVFSSVPVGQGDNGINYNFGELLPTPPVTHLSTGMTATIGYWQNKNGQALLRQMNGSASSTAMGNWMAATFPGLYGAGKVYSTLGKTNTQVAALFVNAFKVRGMKVDAQAMAVAFAIYTTNTALAGGSYATSFGFITNALGTGSAVINVGSAGAALGFANNSNQTILSILQAVSARASSNGLVTGANQSIINTLLTAINEQGDIL